LVFVDFGMTGTLPSTVREGLQEIAIAVGTQDASRLVRAYQTLGVLLPGADTARLEEAEAAMFDRFWGKSMKELTRIHPREMREFGHQFRDLMFELPFQVPTNLIYFGRCVAILSGICTGLDSEFNVFENLAPYARSLVTGEEGEWLEAILEWLKEQGGMVLAMPGRVDRVLSKLEEGRLEVVAKASPSLERSLHRLSRAISQLGALVTFAVMLLIAVLFYLNDEPLLATVGFGLAVFAFGWAVLRGR
jgi:predicted unusual protein kinase regulating ubiquinone biosynthesis (AarF/ABC1/UbiB family)